MLDHEKCQATVSSEVIAWLNDQNVQDLDLCRFLNSCIFSNESDFETKIVVSSIENPSIDVLKIDLDIFLKKAGIIYILMNRKEDGDCLMILLLNIKW